MLSNHVDPDRPKPAHPLTPRVAVVMPVFNKAKFVAETLSSVMRQTYRNIELILVDDGSTDGSAEVACQALTGFAFQLIELDNGGVSRARNTGAAAASEGAEYLLFLDADDVLTPDTIERLVGHLHAHPQAAACYCRLNFIDPDGRSLPDRPTDERWTWSRFGRRRIQDGSLITPIESIWTRFWAIPSCCLVRRTAFDATDGWDRALCPPASVFTAEDKDMAIQLALQGELHRLPDRLVDYRILPSSHKDALYDGYKALNLKWWSAVSKKEAPSRLRRVIRFEYRMAALDAMEALGPAIRRPAVGGLLATSSSAVVAIARWILTGPRMAHWSRAASHGC